MSSTAVTSLKTEKYGDSYVLVIPDMRKIYYALIEVEGLTEPIKVGASGAGIVWRGTDVSHSSRQLVFKKPHDINNSDAPGVSDEVHVGDLASVSTGTTRLSNAKVTKLSIGEKSLF